MKAGKLRHLITIERPVDNPDGQGGSNRSWQRVRQEWASIEPLSSVERLTAGGVEARISETVICRYSPDITSDCRIVHGSKIFSIVGPPLNIDGRDRELQMLCSERTNG